MILKFKRSSVAGPSAMNRPDFTVHRDLEGPTKGLLPECLSFARTDGDLDSFICRGTLTLCYASNYPNETSPSGAPMRRFSTNGFDWLIAGPMGMSHGIPE
jgi:hypothetical protein